MRYTNQLIALAIIFSVSAVSAVAYAQGRQGAGNQTAPENTESAESVTANANRATTTGARGKMMSEDHRSAVSTFVQSLLGVADREKGIGEQVRQVARSQGDSATTTIVAMKRVEERNSVRTFFFGCDYKNLGVIRSELATTTQNIAKLKTLLAEAVSDEDKAELITQIQNLEGELEKVNTYVETNESKFSLFGWFNKLISK